MQNTVLHSRNIVVAIYFFSPSHLSASTLRSVPARIMTCQCPRSSAISVVIWFLAISSLTRSRHLSFGRPRFRFPSTVICKIFLVASSLSLLWTCPNHLSLFSLRNSAIGYMRASFQMSTFLTWSSLVFPLAHRSMRISVVCNFLSSFFLTAQHSAPYTMAGCNLYSRLVHFVFQLCWYVPVAHHTSSFPPFWPGNLYSVVYVFLCSSVGIEHWAQILKRFHCLHFLFLNVDSLVFFWAWHVLLFGIF